MHKFVLVAMITAYTLIAFFKSLDYFLLVAGLVSVTLVLLGDWLAEKATGEDLGNGKD